MKLSRTRLFLASARLHAPFSAAPVEICRETPRQHQSDFHQRHHVVAPPSAASLKSHIRDDRGPGVDADHDPEAHLPTRATHPHECHGPTGASSHHHVDPTASTVEIGGTESAKVTSTESNDSRAADADERAKVEVATGQTGPRAEVAAALRDSFGRGHNYLRISLTERCNLRCVYCMPEQGIDLTAKEHLLTDAELIRLVNVFAKLGVTKIRLTGGEPLVKPNCVDLAKQMRSVPGIESLGITTNAILLPRYIHKLKDAGVTALNLSLDTLQADKYLLLTRKSGFGKVEKSLALAAELGFKNVKINCVVMRGVNDDELPAFAALTREQDLEVRFIEYMPFDENKWERRKMVPFMEMMDRIEIAATDAKTTGEDGGVLRSDKLYSTFEFVKRREAKKKAAASAAPPRPSPALSSSGSSSATATPASSSVDKGASATVSEPVPFDTAKAEEMATRAASLARAKQALLHPETMEDDDEAQSAYQNSSHQNSLNPKLDADRRGGVAEGAEVVKTTAAVKTVAASTAAQVIDKSRVKLEHVGDGETARLFRLPGYRGTVGFITSMTTNFCSSCNRLRLTADGQLKTCLFGNDELSLRDLMRAGATDAELEIAIAEAVQGKRFAHGGMDTAEDIAKGTNRPMIKIGG